MPYSKPVRPMPRYKLRIYRAQEIAIIFCRQTQILSKMYSHNTAVEYSSLVISSKYFFNVE